MQPLKYLLMLLGVGLFGSASALVAYDIILAEQLRQLLQRQARAHASARALVCRIGFPGSRAGQGLR
jgi:hypothetical protein